MKRQTLVKNLFFLFSCCFFESALFAQAINDAALFTNPRSTTTDLKKQEQYNPDRPLTISLLLPLDGEGTNAKLSEFFSSPETAARLKYTSTEALDFYEGFLASLNLTEPFTKVNLQVYDVGYGDSLLLEIIQKQSLSFSDIIVGPSSVSGAKMVAEFCKTHKIINVQPFVISKNISLDNQHLIKLEPAIEAHIERMAKTITDSFYAKKIIIYHTNMERSRVPAIYFDTLFKKYNADTFARKINYRLVPVKDSLNASSVRNFAETIDSNAVVVYCGYETGFVEHNLRVASRKKAITFGMPTWIDDELLRVDYMNNSNLHFTNIFYPDTTLEQQKIFATSYPLNYKHLPSRASYLGYDVCQFLLLSVQLNGLNFIEKAEGNPYRGIGYNFDLEEVRMNAKDADARFMYYGNKGVHQFKIKDYQIEFVE